ncbi:hypothetical protein ISTM_473 [Insectomime virus]|uniref:Uncharacterized protein n=1 Tax=Tunisvirus fontaine2 TaxID=1421067 RepID=V9SE76_9VIRU|nr:hypothetical protein D1R32_gp328 [Tunisvirus fontaine2]AHA46371.1 hypothetical protein ISTM_473 [Insectomime virus]AHC55045.1 hypothetical protein TNS_ORF327 [Tunisvirus fontaine2]
MDEIRKIVPWPLVNISTITSTAYFVMPGVTFEIGEEDGVAISISANFSGRIINYIKGNIDFFMKTLQKLVESEQKRNGMYIGKLLEQVEKERDRYKRKYKKLKYAPGGEEYEKAKADFYEKI